MCQCGSSACITSAISTRATGICSSPAARSSARWRPKSFHAPRPPARPVGGDVTIQEHASNVMDRVGMALPRRSRQRAPAMMQRCTELPRFRLGIWHGDVRCDAQAHRYWLTGFRGDGRGTSRTCTPVPDDQGKGSARHDRLTGGISDRQPVRRSDQRVGHGSGPTNNPTIQVETTYTKLQALWTNRSWRRRSPSSPGQVQH